MQNTKNKNPLVSVVIPGRMSGSVIGNCLKTLRNQLYKNIEVIIVDGNSPDNTKKLAKKYKCRYYNFSPNLKPGLFDAPHKRNYGAAKAKGKYIYYADADMELPPNTVKEAVELAEENNLDAVIIRQDSYGTSIWANSKWLERRCYWGDDEVEAPRFIKTSVWKKLGGLDESLGAGGDDWDMYQKLLLNNNKVGRTKSVVLNNEGNLTLKKLWKKRFMYGQDTLLYIKKRPNEAGRSYFPIRKAYLKNWRLFLINPGTTVAFIFMRIVETIGLISGIAYSYFIND